MRLARAVFLDKDGTLIENLPYNVNPEAIRLAPGACEGLPLLAAAGYRLVVVSNQSGVARGLFPEAALGPVRTRVERLLQGPGVTLDDFLYCPHHPEGTVAAYSVVCECRKPAPGMLLTAAERLGLDLGRSWMVGDSIVDVEAGRRAGCRTVLVGAGAAAAGAEPDFHARDLLEAARLILGADEGRAAGPLP